MKVFGNVLAVVLGMMLTGVAMAQAEGGAAAAGLSGQAGLIAIGAALAVGFATFGAATGQSRASTAVLEGIARNPGAKDQLFQPFIIGLVFMEFQALLGFVIAFMWTGKI